MRTLFVVLFIALSVNAVFADEPKKDFKVSVTICPIEHNDGGDIKLFESECVTETGFIFAGRGCMAEGVKKTDNYPTRQII